MTGSVGHVQFKTFTFTTTFTTTFTFTTLQPLFMDGVQPLLFNTQSLGLPGTHIVDLRRKNDRADHRDTQLFSTQDSWTGNPAPKPLGHCLFRLTHLLFIYEQTLFNFSNIQLEQQINFLHNLFFIHPAIWNVNPLFKQLSKTKAN